MAMFFEPRGFQWDEGNHNKNYLKHAVASSECEEIFFDAKKLVFDDIAHSNGEERHILLGQTFAHQILTIVFTIRDAKMKPLPGLKPGVSATYPLPAFTPGLKAGVLSRLAIRVISARDASRKERKLYHEETA